MAYLEKSAALAAVLELPAVRSLPTEPDHGFLDTLLIASAGRPRATLTRNGVLFAQGTTVYRHYFVGARFLETLRSQHVLESGQGAKFTGLKVPIASLMALQNGDDLSLNLEVPHGYEAVAVTMAQSTGAKPFIASRSSTTTLRP
ncbi:MAG: hypothetical protein ACHWZW_02900 [Spirulina sp.]